MWCQRRIVSLSGCMVVGAVIAALSGAPAVGDDKATDAGWTPLFDGTGLDAFDPESSSPPDEWKVAKGVLSTGDSTGGWLKTRKEYSDFELRLEFRMSKRANSGVFLRADGGVPHEDGLEVQLLDDAAYPDGPRSKACGALMLESGPLKSVSKKAGEWQTLHVTCKGPNVQVRLNGTLVIDEDLEKNPEREAGHSGRTKRRGHIGLQNRGELVDFRKIEVREIR